MKPTFKQWILAFRPWSFPASTMPALAAITYLYFRQQTAAGDDGVIIHWANGWLALLGAVLLHAAGNLISDYFDYKYRVDRKESFGSSRMLVDGVFTPAMIFYYGLLFLGAGSLIGIHLFFNSGWNLLWIGLAGVLGAYFYYKLKYMALGDLLIFVIYGQLIALGTAYVLIHRLDVHVLLLSAPIGLLIVSILHANNTRDILHDGKAHIQTLSMRMGVGGAKIYYTLLVCGSYLMILLLVVFGVIHPFCLSVFVTLPLALKNVKQMQTATIEQLERIKDLDAASAQLVLLFSLLITASNVAVTCF
jgi:1,4-dihydroxy-2-naphthoate octaprenyltransferase